MKVLIAAASFASNISGIQRHALNVVRCLLKQEGISTVHLVIAPWHTILGYKGKQVRDNIHSADLIQAFHHFFRNPRCGEVYNIGGGRFSNCSMLEAVALCESITGDELNYTYVDENRRGDHIWWISNISRFKADYPGWSLRFDVPQILQQIYEANVERWGPKCLI